MKKIETKKPLPKLKIRTLDHDELSNVTGGLPPAGGDNTTGTRCMCCIDGVDEGD